MVKVKLTLRAERETDFVKEMEFKSFTEAYAFLSHGNQFADLHAPEGGRHGYLEVTQTYDAEV